MSCSRIDMTRYIVLPVWYRCNNHCTICMLSGLKRNLPPIGFDNFKALIADIVRDARYENLILSGAEITTFSGLESYLEFARDRGWFKKLQIQTNGRKLSNPDYLNRLIDAGLNEVFISVHGIGAVHDAVTRVPGSFNQTLKGIHNLADRDVNVITNTVLTRSNVQHLPELLTRLCSEAISEIHLWNYYPMDAVDRNDLLVSMAEFAGLLPRLASIVRSSGKALVLKHFPQCLSAGEPVVVDGGSPALLMHDRFWSEFAKNQFGTCFYRDRCTATNCWGLSAAHMRKYGDERDWLSPVTETSGARQLEPVGSKPGNRRLPLEATTGQDRFFDFCMWEYRPKVPHANKFRSANLLMHSFDALGVDGRGDEVIRRIREAIGEGRTVWGIKNSPGGISWEFYFYDYRRRDRTVSVARVLDALRPMVPSGIAVNDSMHYFMFSIDIDGALLSGKRPLDEVHLYIGNVGSAVSSGISYSATAQGMSLENFYFFFDAEKQMDEIVTKVVCSAFMDSSRVPVDQVLWPELRNCKIIVVANKKQHDGVYFSGITIDQLIFFLTRMNYPETLVSFIKHNRAMLDHLQYDVGFDYRMEGGALSILKSCYYGVF